MDLLKKEIEYLNEDIIKERSRAKPNLSDEEVEKIRSTVFKLKSRLKEKQHELLIALSKRYAQVQYSEEDLETFRKIQLFIRRRNSNLLILKRGKYF